MIVKLTQEEQIRCWAMFQSGGILRTFVDEQLNADIEADRAKLEKCTSEDLSGLQARIAARRELLGFFARKDKPKT